MMASGLPLMIPDKGVSQYWHAVMEKEKELEKKQVEIKSLQNRLKAKEVQANQLADHENRLKKKETRVERLANQLRTQRDKLKALQEHAQTQMLEYQVSSNEYHFMTALSSVLTLVYYVVCHRHG